MHHTAITLRLSSARALPIVMGGAILVPTRAAHAIPDASFMPLDIFTREETFVLGCAAGAVLGGLAVALMGRHSRRQLTKRLDQAVKAAYDAQAAADRMKERLDLLETFKGRHAATREAPVARDEGVEVASGVAREEPKVSTALVSVSSAYSAERVTDERESRAGKRDMPIINRGSVREASPEDFVDPALTRAMSGAGRAEYIDYRIPRLDDALFPDASPQAAADEDDFETAVRAMEETLSYEAAEEPGPAFDEGDQSDAMDVSAYVDLILQEEIDLYKSKSARRFSRAHLTMFEGTGDLNAMRHKARYKARHLHRVSKEA